MFKIKNQLVTRGYEKECKRLKYNQLYSVWSSSNQ